MVTDNTPAPDVHAMVVIHRIFRQGLDELAALAGRVPAGDTEWAAAVAGQTRFLLSALHHHHTAEDDYLWPLLTTRCPAEADLFAHMASQHAAVDVAVSTAHRALADWQVNPGGQQLAVALDDVLTALRPHLDEEEARILPLCLAYVTAAEWQTMGDAAFAPFSNDEKFLALGWMVASATPTEAAEFVGRLPLLVRVLWSVAGSRRFRRQMNAMRGAGPRRRQSTAA